MLEVSVGDERADRHENRAGRKDSQTPRIQRRHWLETENYKPVNKKNRVENQKSSRVLLPVLRSAIEFLFEPSKESRRVILSVHDPGQVTAERDRQKGRKDQHRNRKEPHS